MKQKARSIKAQAKEFDFIKIETSALWKSLLNEWKRLGENIYKSYIC